ncbi:hypothetical protein O3M35_004007 [Rhynocoris fuscipes]|uniref:Uncharacterized protein n=1 Tax=Rhynocoris fuscipes TaxID=488301 RepID=A0AAW1CPE5_9HEMI
MKGFTLQLIVSLYFKLILTSTMKKPQCYEILPDGTEEKRCSIEDKYRKTEYSLKWKLEGIRFYEEFYLKNSSKIYTNITLIFPYKDDVVTIALEKGTPEKIIWHIHPETPKCFPMVFKLAYIPFPKSDIVLRRNTMNSISSKPCNYLEGSNCAKLIPSDIRLRPLSRTELKFSYTGHSLDLLYVDLISSSCKSLECTQGKDDCFNSTPRMSSYYLINSSNGLHFQDLKPNYYCARVSSENECCFSATETVQLRAENDTVAIVKFTINQNSPFLVICITLIVLCGLILAAKSFLDYRKSRSCVLYFDSRKTNRNLLTNSQFNQADFNFINEMPLIDNSKIEILLLYPNEGDSFQIIMDSFKNILEFYAYKIWDPNDEESIEMINENMWQWTQYIFNKDKLRIILVETNKTKNLLNMDINTISPADYHNDRLFYFAIDKIKQNQVLSTDYTRLFRIRFDIYPEKTNFIVPLTSYKIPEHLPDFIEALLGLMPGTINYEMINEKCSIKLKIFLNALEQYKH